MPKLFDVHTHTHFAAYEKDSAEVIRRALDGGTWIVNVGTDKNTSAKAVEVANQYPEGVYATVGLHPNDVGKEEFDPDYYKKLAQDKKVVAIGECGLDYYRIKNQELRIKQEGVFKKHIELAREIQKPLMIHCREAFTDLIRILDSCFPSAFGPRDWRLLHDSSQSPGIIHFFSGTLDDAKKLLELGFSFSFGGVITFARDYDEQIKHIPLDRILLETDAPYVTPTPHRGKRNEPAYVEEVAKKLAEIKNTTFDEIAQKTTKNAIHILQLISTK